MFQDGQIYIVNYSCMPANKINLTQQQLSSQDRSFQLLLHRLKEERPERYDHNPSEPPLSEHEHNPPSRQLFSQGAKSIYVTPSAEKRIAQGDPVLRNPNRIGHGNRYAVKQFQLPSHYFTPTKNKLQEHLHNSRVLSSSVNPSSPVSKHPLFRQGQLAALQQSQALKRTKNHIKLQDVNCDLVLKYCLVNRLTPSSEVQQILIYFVRLLELVSYSLPEPKIQKYRDCIYFGPGKVTQEQGLLYFFNNSLYLGQLKNHTMHGNGVQIFFNPPQIFKGQFKDGQMLGYFEVKNQQERYNGAIRDRLYHGHGKLINEQGFVEGQFSNGKLVYVSYSTKKPQKAQKQFAKQTSMMQMHQISQKRASQDSRMNMRQYVDSSHKRSTSTHFEWDRSKYIPQRQQQCYVSQQNMEMDPWSKQSRVNRVVHRVDASDVLEFSYPFGQDLPEPHQNINKNYRSRIRNPQQHHFQNPYQEQTHRKQNSYDYQPQQNPEQEDHYKQHKRSIRKQTPKMAEWSTNFPQKYRAPEPDNSLHPRRKVIGHFTRRPDSSYGQEEPLRFKC